MVRSKKIFSSLFCLLLSSLSYSQSFEHRKFKYDWNDALRIKFDQNETYKDYNAVILFEETTLDIELKNIKRYQVIQFNDSAAIEDYNLFRVPIPMDVRNASLNNIYRADTSSFPQLLYEKINFFDARIIRNGEFVKAVLDEFAFKKEERTGEYMIPYYIHYFYVRNLQPGDQLEVIISHHWPLYTFKHYINEMMPKQEVIININNSPLGQVDTYVNPQLANFIANEQSKDNLIYRITYENVEAVDQTISTHIYDLPRVEFYENKNYKTSGKFFRSEYVDTISWRDLLYRFVTRIDPGELRTWENYDLQSYKTSLFFDKMKKMAGEQTKGEKLMNLIHQYAVDKFGYKNDFNYFIHVEHGFTELGNYIEKDTLREASRHEFYFNMLDRVDEPYYKVFLQDRRQHVIDTSIVSIYYDDYLSYMMFDKDSVPYLFFPKTGRFGYYTNELPFYLTDQYAYLIPQTVPRKIYDKDPEKIKYPLWKFAPYISSANVKKNRSVINISLKDKIASVESTVLLSGQFSTMLRGYYQRGWIDTTVTPTYYTDVFKKMADVKIEQDSSLKVFPYTHQFKIKGDNWQNVFVTVDGDYVIDLSDLINIHFQNIDLKTFKANYRHDFEGKEEYIIELNFDELITIESMETYTHEIINDGFIFSSSLVKVADNQYGLKVSWDILKEYSDQKKMPQLDEAFDLIKKFTRLKLKVKPQ